MVPEQLSISALAAAYDAGLEPEAVIEEVLERIEAYDDPAVFIHLGRREPLRAQARALKDKKRSELPLYGVPFAVKDNIDVAGMPTTAGNPDYSYEPEASAPVVAALEAAGAMCIGKTNLDQFATGLVGTRSPYGIPRNPHHPDYIPGGSSSGSAASVAAGLVTFSLGTDTAGSGRVPAAFCGLIGWKPSRGLLSTRGVVPAVATLDCVSVFARSAADCAAVKPVVAQYDAEDSFARPAPRYTPPRPRRIGVPRPDQLDFVGDAAAAEAYCRGVEALGAVGCELVEIDFTPFSECAEMLYGGAWVAERAAAVGDFIAEKPDNCDPSVAAIVGAAQKLSAVDAYKGEYRLRALQREVEPVWQAVDAIAVPTTPTIYTRDEIAAEPIAYNSVLGRTNNFTNLLDLCGAVVPTGPGRDLMPTGMTVLAPAFADDGVLDLVQALHAQIGAGVATPDEREQTCASESLRVLVIGAHLRGQPLNHQLTDRGAQFLQEVTTAATYQLFALPTTPAKPGMIRVADGGTAIVGELWAMSAEGLGELVALTPSPLGFGRVQLADGTEAVGFLCEASATTGCEDISAHGGWLAWHAARAEA